MSEVDHRAVPGTFEKEPGGEFVRTDEPTLPADASHGGPELDLDELREIAEGSKASGFPPPPQVAAAIEAAEAAEAEATAKAKREARSKPADPKPTTPGASSAETPKE